MKLQALEKCDIAIIGGGLLGTCISYWLSTLYDIQITVIEKEQEVAMHTSSRNTGVLHSPFYLNPEKKGKLARAAFLSHKMWNTFAQKKNLPWKMVGTLEVALDIPRTRYLKNTLSGVQKMECQKMTLNSWMEMRSQRGSQTSCATLPCFV